MCAAEIDINRQLAPEIYLGVAPVRRGRDGALVLGEPGEACDDAVDWLVVMRRFDEDGLLDRMAARGALTPELMAALGARIARFHDGLPADCRGLLRARRLPPFGRRRRAPDARSGRAARSADQRGAGRGDAAGARAVRRSGGAPRRRPARCGAATAICICATSCCSDGEPVPFDAIEFSDKIANIDVLYDLAFALMDLCAAGPGRARQPAAERMAVADRRAAGGAARGGAGAAAASSCRAAPRSAPMSIRRSPPSAAPTTRRRAPTSRRRSPSCSRRRRACWRSAACRAAARRRWR